MGKCYLCNDNATIKDCIGNVEYNYCMKCYLEVFLATQEVKEIAEIETIYDLVEKVKEEKDNYYLAVFKAILKRKDFKHDIKSIIQAIEG